MLALMTVAKGLFWIALMPVFKIADEPTHYENVAFRGEFFEAPHSDKPEPLGTTIHEGSPPDVRLAWNRTNELFRNHFVAGVRSVREETELARMASDPKTRQGTGRLTSSNYPGFYYDSAVPIYEIFKRTSLLTRIAAVRCVSLAFGVLAVLATFFAASLVVDSQPLAIAAALIVMLQPMESQMIAAVNNDAAVIGLAAALFYVQLRFLVRAPEIPSLRWGVGMALLAGAIIFTKPHGFAMLPGCGFVCGWILWKNLRSRRAWLFAVATAAVAAIFIVAALLHMQQTGEAAVMAHTPAVGAALPPSASPDFSQFLASLTDDYKLYLFRSFIGQFGWLEYSIPSHWLDGIRAVWLLAQIGVAAAIAGRVIGLPGAKWVSIPGLVFAGATAVLLVAFILYAEYRFRLIGVVGVIQGRNMLFALPALAVIVAAGYGALVPARFRSLSATALAASALALHAGAILVIFRNHYGT
ncbi:MAG TPA: DUF2142 domain-containing protein [Polyangia bacterium]